MKMGDGPDAGMRAGLECCGDPELARRLAALAHPARLQILRWMACRDDCRCKDLVSAMPLAQSTVSQHLKVLAGAGLVRSSGRRSPSSYGVDRAALVALAESLSRFTDDCCAPADGAGSSADTAND